MPKTLIDTFLEDSFASPLQLWAHPHFGKAEIRVWVKRDDLLHPFVSGNKWRKLKYNLQQFQKEEKKGIVTWGGAFSNHIAAVAAAGHLLGIPTIGIIRGEVSSSSNATLSQAIQWGMQCHFVDRTVYRSKQLSQVPSLPIEVQATWLHLPEGGTNHAAVLGCQEISNEIQAQLGFSPDYIVAASGTGGTLAGIIAGASANTKVIGISALKGDFQLSKDIQKLLDSAQATASSWTLETGYHLGGYAKYHPTIRPFIEAIEKDYQLPLDPIYTAKTAMALLEMAEKGHFPKGANVVFVHTGGLQGRKGYYERYT